MKILVTGAFGYIGGRLSQFLIRQTDHEVIMGSRNNDEAPSWLPESKVVPLLWDSDSSIEEICTDVDCVVHLAAMNAQDSMNDPLAALEFNAVTTARLLQAAIKQGVKRFIYLSTAHVYGSPLTGDITEESNTGSTHPYATSHRAGEDVVLAAHQQGDIEGIVIRLSNAYGAPAHKHVNCWMLLLNDLCLQAITTQTMQLQTSGMQRRDFITLTDTCRAILHLLELSPAKLSDGLFNVGGAWSPTIQEMTQRLAERIQKITGKLPDILYNENEGGVDVESEYFSYGIQKLLDTGFSIDDCRYSDDEIDDLINFAINNVINPCENNKANHYAANKEDNGIVRLSKSCLSSTEKYSVMKVLDNEKLGMGENVHQLEKELTNYFGRPVICVNSGTAALHLAIQASGIGLGDEVLVPSLTYVASFQAISATGAKPVACDIDLETCTLDWKDAERRITSKTKAIMPVHYTGGVGDLDGIYSLANQYNLRVIEDAAHAFGTTYKGKLIGAFGDITCFSFDGIKNITCGEGGCIVLNDHEIQQKIYDARLLGVENDSEMRNKAQRSWDFQVSSQGWRYHMSNIMAAIGIEQLKRFPSMAATRQRLCIHYDKLLANHPRIKILSRDYEQVVPHIYVVRIKELSNRTSLREYLAKFGIQTGIHYKPNHKLNLYKNSKELELSVTNRIFPELLTLPLHPDLTEDDVGMICDRLKDYLS